MVPIDSSCFQLTHLRFCGAVDTSRAFCLRRHLSRGGSKSVLKAARLHRALLKVQTNASQGKFAEVHQSSVWVCLKNMKTINAGWWFGTCFIFPYIGNNNPNWLIFFRGVETGLIITLLWPFRTETDDQPADGMGPISRKMRNRQMVKQQVLLGKTSNKSSDCWSILPYPAHEFRHDCRPSKTACQPYLDLRLGEFTRVALHFLVSVQLDNLHISRWFKQTMMWLRADTYLGPSPPWSSGGCGHCRKPVCSMAGQHQEAEKSTLAQPTQTCLELGHQTIHWSMDVYGLSQHFFLCYPFSQHG